MAIWSKKSKSSNQTSNYDHGMIGGLSVDAQHGDRRRRQRGASPEDITLGDYMTGVPNIRLSSILKSLMKQIVWIIPVFLLGVFLIHYLTKDIKRSYHAEGRLLVQIGPEYIYTPIGAPSGNNGGSVLQTPDTIALNEVGIMKNTEIIETVVDIMTTPPAGVDAKTVEDLFHKVSYEKIRKAEAICERNGDCRGFEDAKAELYKRISDAYGVSPRPKSSLIDVAFSHENPAIAVETLNQLILAYKAKRDDLFVLGVEDTIADRRDETINQLKSNERAIARFLEGNGVSNFESEQTGLQKRAEDLKTSLNTLRGQISETERSLATVEDQLRGTNETINLYVDDRASQRVAQAELELKQLLAKYLPTSNPVRQKRTELEELKRLQTSNNGRAAGGRRVGPNPVYQALVTRRNTLKASADSFREKEFTLQRQLDSAVGKVSRLTKISPEYQNLLRERKTLTAALDTYNARAQEAAVNLAQKQAEKENIKVISQSKTAIKGKNIGKLIWVGGSFAWGLTLMIIALLIVFLDPRNYQGVGDGNNRPRRSRVTDKTSSNAGDMIPEAVPEYAPSKPLVATGQSAIAATRAYNAAEHDARKQPQSPQPDDSQTQETYVSNAPTVYDPAAHQSPVTYGDPKDYYAAPHEDTQMQPTQTAASPDYAATYGQNHAQTHNVDGHKTDVFDAQNNPYLNPETQNSMMATNQWDDAKDMINGLPVLGSFSAAKG